MGLSADLRALGPVLEPPEEQWGDPELPQALLCPRLRTTYSPRVSWQAFRPAAEAEGPAYEQQWARLWDPGPPAPDLGSSLARNSQRPPRYGLKGLTSQGRRQIWRSLALLEEQRSTLVFWTVTLPEEAVAQLGALDAVAAFQDRLRDELLRQLELAGAPQLVIGVAELQPARTMREVRPAPHWHVVFPNRRSSKKGDYWLKLKVLDRVIESACWSAGIRGKVNLSRAGKTEPIKRSVRAYMAKYMSKGSQDCRRWVGSEHESLLPRQWWFWSRPLRVWVLQHILPIAFAFLAWVHEHRTGLVELGLIAHRRIPLKDPRAPDTYEINWLGCDRLGSLIYLWQTDDWDAEWQRNFRRSNVSPHPGQHPQQHQHL